VFLEQLDRPTLALFGERDAVVDWRDSIDVYRSAFSRSGNRDPTVRTFKDADHEMVSVAKPQQADAAFAYADGYIATMIDWLEARHFTNRPPQ
jgi:alpha-beta hydrolase superfamily lysophospholipase